MKKLVVNFLVITLVITGCSQKKNEVTTLLWGTQYFLYSETLNGKVKDIVQNTYWATLINGKTEKGSLLSQKELQDSGMLSGFHALYNDFGVLLRHDYFGSNSKILWSHVNELKDGRVFKEKSMKNDTLTGYSLFFYDKKGFIDSVPMYNNPPDTIAGILLLSNDENGKITKMKVLNSKGALTNYTVNTLDNQGRIIKLSNFTAKDSLESELVITYNDHNFWGTIKSYDKHNKLMFDVSGTYTYDNKGNWTQAVWSRWGKPWEIFERTYIYY